ncbi:hypothetical protein [Gaoshiqia sp. Z1-71]|uniref:hypothetical protein n=1 Tax=Gaoshiqia hydrogeniformans TaxID=3290090 RepID=UPI003BF85B39
MNTNNWFFLILLVNFLTIESYAGFVWTEEFNLPNKGTWGDADGITVHTDLEGIDQWTLNTVFCEFTAENDYVKTVSTSGGRFEAQDCDGEAIWMSRWISIKNKSNVRCELTAWETGSGNTASRKYLYVFYQLDNQPETLFESNGINEGNWGEALASQSGLNGDSLRIIVKLNSSYASDKVIFDHVSVESEDPPLLPENLAQAGDILINELLFNPYADGSDFVELFNRSEKSIRLDHLFIASRDGNQELRQIYAVSAAPDYMEPGAYLLLSEDTTGIPFFYLRSCPENFWQMEKLPSYPNASGYVVLLDDSLNVIDELAYRETMHNPLLANRKGVSLERVSADRESDDPENWLSAAAAVGFATPGCPNSMQLHPEYVQAEIRLEPTVFSPNNDGYQDYLSIHYRLPEPDYRANLKLFDSRGSYLQDLVKNETIGQEGEWTWTGMLEDGSKARIGIYVIYIELISPTGQIKQIRKSCTLTDRLF